MVDLFTSLANCIHERNDERQAQIMRKMAATVGTIPYDMLAEFGHNYIQRPDRPVAVIAAMRSAPWTPL